MPRSKHSRSEAEPVDEEANIVDLLIKSDLGPVRAIDHRAVVVLRGGFHVREGECPNEREAPRAPPAALDGPRRRFIHASFNRSTAARMLGRKRATVDVAPSAVHVRVKARSQCCRYRAFAMEISPWSSGWVKHVVLGGRYTIRTFPSTTSEQDTRGSLIGDPAGHRALERRISSATDANVVGVGIRADPPISALQNATNRAAVGANAEPGETPPGEVNMAQVRIHDVVLASRALNRQAKLRAVVEARHGFELWMWCRMSLSRLGVPSY
ncbi:unnamed protein product [Closterium sp. Yama58-4]|nr:unnamed protein product [Closterium sp. Yama58-4]